MFWLRDWVWHAYLMSDGSRSRDHTRLIGFTFCSAESWEELMQFGAKIAPNCIVLGHLLVPELIIKGWDGLNLANSKEMFIGIVNLTNFDQLLNSSYWQFVVHWQGVIEQMNLVSRLQVANMEVSIKDGSNWKTIIALSKLGQRLIKKYQIGWK